MTGQKSAIRRATLDDVARLIELGAQFYAEDGKRPASTAELARFAVSHICDPERACFVAGDPAVGVLCGVIAPHYFTGEPTAFKTAWYVLPGAKGYGAYLFRRFEAWAKEKDARRLIVAGRHERTLGLLSHLDYQPLETVYAKDLPWQKPPFPSL
jgi:hypothetical protein